MNIYIFIFERILQLDLKQTLIKEGYQVHFLETETEVIHKLQYKNTVLIITFKALLQDDLMSILKSHPDIPIILLSADLTEEGFKELNLTPNFRFFKKPIHIDEFKRELRNIMLSHGN